jgi:23S rRNA (guanosine2251-2'-O)-methyltransferase
MEDHNDLIIGRNAVAEALRSGRSIDTLLVARGDRSGSLGKLVSECRERDIVIKQVDERKLDFLCGQGNHQGVAAYAAVKEYAQMEDIFALARERGEPPFLILCDELEDPHNLGAILRTAETAGAHGVIVPKRRSASLSYAVGKASAGAVEYVPVVRVANLAAAMDDLKQKGVWITARNRRHGVVRTGLCRSRRSRNRLGRARSRPPVKEKCDFLVSLPMNGRITSLNASVAAGILMYEVARQRAGTTAFDKR